MHAELSQSQEQIVNLLYSYGRSMTITEIGQILEKHPHTVAITIKELRISGSVTTRIERGKVMATLIMVGNIPFAILKKFGLTKLDPYILDAESEDPAEIAEEAEISLEVVERHIESVLDAMKVKTLAQARDMWRQEIAPFRIS